MPDAGSPLTAAHLDALYPYHLILSEESTIVGLGTRLRAALPSSAIGAPFAEYFRVLDPEGGFSALRADRPVPLLMVSDCLPLPLRGTALYDSERRQSLFLGSLYVRTIEELARVGLTLADIPRHDSSLDYLLALQAHGAAFAEARTLAAKLTEEKTQLREANRRLRESEAMYRSVVENVREIIFRTDADGNWTFLNVAWERITGFSVTDSLGRNFRSFLHPDDGPAYEARFRELMEGRRDYTRLEARFITRDGSQRWIEVLAQSTRNDREAICGTTGTLFDITERKRVEEQRTALTRELQRSNRDLSEFAAVASHDLQEPLRKIILFAEQLRTTPEELTSEQTAECAGRISRAARRMRSLVRGLLDYSRVTSGARPFRQVSLDRIVTEAVADLEATIRRVGGVVLCDPLPDIEADPVQMRQLMQNLIGNALKFHRPGVPPEVRVYAERRVLPDDSEVLLLHCRDNGIGFESQFRNKVFEVFERLHPDSEYEGTGMGLAICRKIIERHNGHIEAYSVPGEGTDFLVSLPLPRPAADVRPVR
ncbi:MAG: PAS domain S-box protein [Capsulimonadales bacterium]|nr:PAS domain S-box protein [Capsulimonadales bacterium]